VESRLTAGIDEAYQDGAILFYSLVNGQRGPTLMDNKGEGANNLGLFAQDEMEFNDNLTVTVGARYDNVMYNYRSFITPSLDARKAFTGVTPKIGISYRLTPQHSVYASLGGGIEVPAGNETDPASTFGQDTVTSINPLLAPIRSTTYEIGTKRLWSLAEGAFIRDVSYDLALYQTAVRDEIVPYRGGRFYFTAGKVRRRGAELGARIAARPGVALQVALTWTDHRYTTYVVDSVHYGRPGVFADYRGNRVVGVPAFTGSVALDISLLAVRPLRARVGVEAMSAFFADDANQVKVPAFRIANLTVGTDRPVGLGAGVGATAFVTVHNLFDRRYIASAFLNPDVVGGEPVAFEPGFPRNVVVGVSFSAR
jgi:iron complex outermembrane receptor protein